MKERIQAAAGSRRQGAKCGAGRILRTDYGTFMAYLYANGKRLRRCFTSVVAAQSWLRAQQAPGNLPPLSAAQYADAQCALALLAHSPGVSLCDAATVWLSSSGAGAGGFSPCLEDAAAQYLEAVRISVAPETLAKYRQVLGKVCGALPGAAVRSVAPSDIAALTEALSGANRNVFLRHVQPFFNWCVKRGFAGSNPCAGVERAKVSAPPPGVLSIEQARRVLSYAQRHAPELSVYLALGLFAGTRPQETRRITPGCIRNGYIVLDASITKTADSRTVRIRPNLEKWLAAYPVEKYPPCRATPTRIKALHKRAGVPWPHDCLRHSFATYAYEQAHDAAAVAAELGHAGTSVFFKHYRALASPGDGERFFSIVP